MLRRMNKMTLLAAIVAAGVLGGIAVRPAEATPPQGFTAVNIVGPSTLDRIHTKSEIDDHIRIKSEDITDVYVTEITIVPGGHGGWHSHPGPSIITVKSGAATFYDECNDFIRQSFAAGFGFVEDAGCVHLLSNEGDVDLKVVVVQIVPFGAPRRIDEPAPAP
jgi:quercetin dioxygenase-like cupin family protein